MFKRVFFAMFLFAATFGFQFVNIEKVSAQDVWVYTDGSGVQYYVMTETMLNETKYRLDRTFSVNVKSVYQDSRATINSYSFNENDGIVHFRVNGDYKGYVYQNTVEGNIWNYGLKYLGIDYQVNYER